jgi:hypothetical protein
MPSGFPKEPLRTKRRCECSVEETVVVEECYMVGALGTGHWNDNAIGRTGGSPARRRRPFTVRVKGHTFPGAAIFFSRHYPTTVIPARVEESPNVVPLESVTVNPHG